MKKTTLFFLVNLLLVALICADESSESLRENHEDELSQDYGLAKSNDFSETPSLDGRSARRNRITRRRITIRRRRKIRQIQRRLIRLRQIIRRLIRLRKIIRSKIRSRKVTKSKDVTKRA